MTLPVTRLRKIILPCGRHSILLSRRCSFYFDLNGPSLPRYIWPALRVSRWYKEKKDEFQSHPLSLKANPYQRRKWNRTAWLPSFFFSSFSSTIKLHFLLTSGWELASNLCLLAGGSLSPSFPVRPRYGTWTRSYDQIRLDLIRIRFHRSSRLGLVLSGPTQELRTAGPLWTVERGEGSRAHSLSGQRAGTFQFQTEYMYITEQNIKKKRDLIW